MTIPNVAPLKNVMTVDLLSPHEEFMKEEEERKRAAARNSRNNQRMWGNPGQHGHLQRRPEESSGGQGGQKNILKALNVEESVKLLGTGIDRLGSVWKKFPTFPPQEEPGKIKKHFSFLPHSSHVSVYFYNYRQNSSTSYIR